MSYFAFFTLSSSCLFAQLLTYIPSTRSLTIFLSAVTLCLVQFDINVQNATLQWDVLCGFILYKKVWWGIKKEKFSQVPYNCVNADLMRFLLLNSGASNKRLLLYGYQVFEIKVFIGQRTYKRTLKKTFNAFYVACRTKIF